MDRKEKVAYLIIAVNFAVTMFFMFYFTIWVSDWQAVYLNALTFGAIGGFVHLGLIHVLEKKLHWVSLS